MDSVRHYTYIIGQLLKQPSPKELSLFYCCCHTLLLLLLMLFVALRLLNRKSSYTTRQLESRREEGGRDCCLLDARHVQGDRLKSDCLLAKAKAITGDRPGAEACWHWRCQDSSRTAIYALASSCGIQCPVSSVLLAAASKLAASSYSSVSFSGALTAFFL